MNTVARSSGKIAQSTAGKSASFRTTRDGIVPSSIDAFHQLTLDAAMRAALTHAGAKLTVEIDASGTRVFLADARSNQLIGGPEDLQKLGTIRTFVSRERKEATAVEAAKELTQLTFLSNTVVKETQPDFVMNPVDSSFAAAMRPLQSALDQLVKNESLVTDNTSVNMRDVFLPMWKTYFHNTQAAYMDVVVALTKGTTIKGLLNQRLFERGVPDWVHARIVSKSFQLGQNEELGKFFFPADPIKGLALSLREWRDDDFLAKQGGLTVASQLLYTLVNDDELVQAICGLDDEFSFENEENPVLQRMLKTKLVVMPIHETPAKVIELGSKVRSGFKFPNPSPDTVTGALVTLGAAVLRVYAANLQSVDLVDEYYSTIVPGAVKRQDVTPTNNFYVQWGKAVDPSTVWRQIVRGGDSDMNLRRKLWRWIRTELRLSETASAGKALANTLGLAEGGGLPHGCPDGGKLDTKNSAHAAFLLTRMPDPVISDPGKIAQVLTRGLTATEIPLWMEFQTNIFRPQGRKKRQPVGLSLSPLSQQGKQLVLRVKQLSPFVAERMTSWLRSFSDERVQLAAVRIANAEFDDLFASSLLDDVDSQSEILDWAETEA
jgi:hypothetical protein